MHPEGASPWPTASLGVFRSVRAEPVTGGETRGPRRPTWAWRPAAASTPPAGRRTGSAACGPGGRSGRGPRRSCSRTAGGPRRQGRRVVRARAGFPASRRASPPATPSPPLPGPVTRSGLLAPYAAPATPTFALRSARELTAFPVRARARRPRRMGLLVDLGSPGPRGEGCEAQIQKPMCLAEAPGVEAEPVLVQPPRGRPAAAPSHRMEAAEGPCPAAVGTQTPCRGRSGKRIHGGRDGRNWLQLRRKVPVTKLRALGRVLGFSFQPRPCGSVQTRRPAHEGQNLPVGSVLGHRLQTSLESAPRGGGLSRVDGHVCPQKRGRTEAGKPAGWLQRPPPPSRQT